MRLSRGRFGYDTPVNPFHTWRIRTLDAVVAIWTCLWIGLGVLVAHDLRELTQLSATIATTGRAMQSIVDAIAPLKSLPIVGSTITPLATTAASEAASVRASGRVSAQSVRQLSVLLGIAVAVAPALPLLVLYIPLRVSQEREARAFRRALADGAYDPVFEEFLAHRAAHNLPYHRLREITTNPWREIQDGHFRRLADAELKRVGVRRPPTPAPARDSTHAHEHS